MARQLAPIPVATGRQKRFRVSPPRTWGVRPNDLAAALAFNIVLILGMWLRHGGADNLGSPGALLTALGQLTALVGTYGALVQLVLMSRSPWMEQLFGLDRLAHWHRWLGFAVTWLICGHVVLTTAGYALGDGSSFAGETWKLLTTFPFVLMATVATGLLVMVAFTSARAARRRLKYETWHFIHLYAYLAIVLSFGHVLAVGTDFSNDQLARVYWIALYLVAGTLILAFRVGHPVLLDRRHRLKVMRVVPEGPGVASVYVTGRDLRNLRARAGQFFAWRFLARDRWWMAHPFSLSEAPNGEYLRITVKGVGDGTCDIARLKPGTRVAVEGPYGVFTTLRRRQKKVLLVAGGIGITPIRALLDELPQGKGGVVLLYRARSWDEVLFRDELEQLIAARQGELRYLVGSRGTDVSDLPEQPFSARSLRHMVPDVVQRDVFVCGSGQMMRELHDSLKEIGVPDAQIHYERFALL
ncbi:MAG: ferredoxin reductase family protein [Candidatus Dormibacteria bacterium]